MADQRKPPAGGNRPTPPSGSEGHREPMVTDFDGGPASGFKEAPPSATGFHKAPLSSGGRVTASVARTPSSRVPIQPGFTDRAPRARVSVPVRYRYQSFIDFVDTQSVNVSRTGMFVTSESPLPLGTLVQFEFSLADGYVILKGTAEVVRVVSTPAAGPKGMGLKFVDLEEKSRKLIDRIIEVNDEEGKFPTVPLADILAPLPALQPTVVSRAGAVGGTGLHAVQTAATVVVQPVKWGAGKLRLVLNPTTAGFFVYNPLLNIKMGGFVIPAESEVSLGTVFAVEIVDLAEKPLLSCKGKVVAKQETRLGIRLTDADKADLGRLQAEVTKLAPMK